MTPDSAAASSSPTPLLGRVIDGRYRLEEQLGTGAAGTTHRARRVEDSSMVVLKLFDEDVSGDTVRRSRFEWEAATLSGLAHPNVVPILDYGVFAGRRYIVSEWLDGESLAQRLRRQQLPLTVAVGITRQVLAALASVHGARLAHRNLKPSDVYLEWRNQGRERVKLLDFAPGMRPGRAVPGGRSFFAPPEGATAELDARSDVYAVGALLSVMLHGAPADVPLLAGPTASGTKRGPVVDSTMQGWIRRAMARDPNERFSGAAEMLQQLIDLLPRDLRSPPDSFEAARISSVSIPSPARSGTRRIDALRAETLREHHRTHADSIAATLADTGEPLEIGAAPIVRAKPDVSESAREAFRASEKARLLVEQREREKSKPRGSKRGRAKAAIENPDVEKPPAPAPEVASAESAQPSPPASAPGQIAPGQTPLSEAAIAPGQIAPGQILLSEAASAETGQPPAAASAPEVVNVEVARPSVAAREAAALADAASEAVALAGLADFASDAPSAETQADPAESALEAPAARTSESSPQSDLELAAAAVEPFAVAARLELSADSPNRTELREDDSPRSFVTKRAVDSSPRDASVRGESNVRPLVTRVRRTTSGAGTRASGTGKGASSPLAAGIAGVVKRARIRPALGYAGLVAASVAAVLSISVAIHGGLSSRIGRSNGGRLEVLVEPTPPAAVSVSDPVRSLAQPAAQETAIAPASNAPDEPGAAAASDEIERPLSINPWEDPVPPELEAVRTLANNGGKGDDPTMRQLREYSRDNPADTRGFLILGRIYMNRFWRGDALAQFEAAFDRDPRSRGAPEILSTLFDLIVAGKESARAEALLKRAYGREALPVIESELEKLQKPISIQRLSAISEKLIER